MTPMQTLKQNKYYCTTAKYFFELGSTMDFGAKD